MKYEVKNDAKIAIVGYGSWGTAIVKIVTENENRVGWYVRNADVIESLEENGTNCRYLSDVEFDTNKLDVFSDINKVKDYDILVFATPSAFLVDQLKQLNVSIEDKFIISAIKGIVTNAKGELVTIAEYFHDDFNIPYSQIGLLSGPCHAEEVAMERLSYLNIVCSVEENAKLLAKKFETHFIKMNTQNDIYGIEYSVVLKNIYALAVGICNGLGYGDNFMAVLITNAVRETKSFLNKSYAFDRDINTSPYLGDLLVTSYSQFSRNRTFGNMIGRGYSINSAKQELGMVAEGYYSASCIHEINEMKGFDMPIAECVYRILYKHASAKKEIKKLADQLK